MNESELDITDDTKQQIIARVQVLDENSRLPAYGTGTIAEPFDLEDQTVRGHLHELSERGIVETKQFGGQKGTRIWWIPEENESPLDTDEVVQAQEQYINWEQIDSERVPEDVLVELAEERLDDYERPTFWNERENDAEVSMRLGFGGLLLLILLEFIGYNLSNTMSDVLILGSVLLITGGILLAIATEIGERLASHDFIPENPDLSTILGNS
jgi:DNA-binding transcriptional ArsR family regulator